MKTTTKQTAERAIRAEVERLMREARRLRLMPRRA
jgi:hypothetical protein